MKLDLRYELTIRDRQGRVLRRRRRLSRSYLTAFINLLNLQMRGAINLATLDTGGVSRDADYNALNFIAAAPLADATHGPVVGTGTTAVAIGDSALATQIAEGSGSGQLSHQVTTLTTPSTVGSTRSFTLQRVFINNSGASITVNECGIYIQGHDGTVTRYFCAVRDLVSPGVAIPNGGSGTLTYTISITA